MGDSLVTGFVEQGFVTIEEAFPRELAEEVRSILWRDTGCNPDDPSTWTRPSCAARLLFGPAICRGCEYATDCGVPSISWWGQAGGCRPGGSERFPIPLPLAG